MRDVDETGRPSRKDAQQECHRKKKCLSADELREQSNFMVELNNSLRSAAAYSRAISIETRETARKLLKQAKKIRLKEDS